MLFATIYRVPVFAANCGSGLSFGRGITHLGDRR